MVLYDQNSSDTVIFAGQFYEFGQFCCKISVDFIVYLRNNVVLPMNYHLLTHCLRADHEIFIYDSTARVN